MRVLMAEPSFYEGETLIKRPTRPTRLMSLTLPYLAAHTPSGVDITIAYDMNEDLGRDYDLASYDVVALTTMSIQLKRTIELLDEIRAAGPKVVVGGPATVDGEGRLLRVLHHSADSVAIGDGEQMWPQVLADAMAGNLKPTYRATVPPSMEGWPLPRWDLVNFEHVQTPFVLPALTARGCPRRCTFCSEFLFSKWLLRPIDDVVNELRAYRDRFGIPRVNIWDDDFLVHPRRSTELLSRLVGEGIEWSCQTDLNLARHPELVDLAVAAGMRAVSFGLESVREANREWLEKTFFTIPESEELLLRLHELGVETSVNVIFGFDYDDPDVFDETLDFLVRTKASQFFPSILYPVPGTPLHAQLEAEGRILAAPVATDIRPPLEVWFKPRHLTPEQLVEGSLEAERQFHALPTSGRNYWLGSDVDVVEA